MSRLTTSDRNQPQQPNQNQNQQIIQNIQQSVRSQSVQQPSSQQFLSLAQQGGSYLIVNNSNSSATGSNVQSTSNLNPQQLPTSSTHPTSPIPTKRLKLDIADSSSSSSTTEDLAALKKRIYEHKLQRLKSLKEK